MHLIGSTGSGKSNLLEHMVRQDITHGRGVCVIDPKGTHPDSLYQSLLIWLHEKGFAKTGIVHIIDPNAKSYITGFNPLSRPSTETALSVVADAALDAFSQAWGGEDMNARPTTQSILTALFSALAEINLTIAEATLLLDPHDGDGIRESILSRITDRYSRTVLSELHQHAKDETNKRGFRERVQGPMNRINKFVRSEAIRAMIGQTERVLDFKSIMDQGHILLVNLGDGEQSSAEDARLLGALVLRSLFLHANKRTNTIPFFLYADECHRYLSGDIPSILDEARSYGLSAILAHQRLGQLRDSGQNMESAFRGCTAVKAVFSLSSIEDGRDIAEEVLPLNLEQPVTALMRETVVGVKRTVLHGGSESENVSASHSETLGRSLSNAHSASITDSENQSKTQGQTVGQSHSQTTGETNTTGESGSTSVSESTASMRGQASGTGHGTGAASFNAQTFESNPDPLGFLLIFPKVPDTILGESRGKSSASSNTRFSSTSKADGTSQTRGDTHTQNNSRSVQSSATQGQSTSTSIQHSLGSTRSVSAAETITEGATQSRTLSESRGFNSGQSWSETFESIYEKRPGAVHGKENVLHFAAKYLRGLPPGHMVLSDGARSIDVIVPHIARRQIPHHEFAAIRETFLAASSYATPVAVAQTNVNQREALLKSSGKAPQYDDEPQTFRVKSRRAATGRDKSRHVGNGSDEKERTSRR